MILGAGASYDCTSNYVPDRHDHYRPPLVTQLFEPRSSFTRILHEYPLAEAAAADIRPELERGSVAVEAFLRKRLKESEHEHDRLKYYAIPLYLQHLLFEIGAWDYASGRGYTAQPDSYDRLISATLRVDEVTFVTLNYDELFDRRLFINAPLTSMGSYLGEGKKWALIKLHGSVNWSRVILNENIQVAPTDPFFAQTFANLGETIDVSDEISLRLNFEIRDKRHDQAPFRLYYPALSAPLGSEDELVCPAEHVQYLRDRLGHWDPLDVLVIGYSGLDLEVLNLLRWSERPIRSLWVANGTEDAGIAAARKIRECVRINPLPGQEPVTILRKGFTDFAQSASLDDYVNRIRSLAASHDAEQRSRMG